MSQLRKKWNLTFKKPRGRKEDVLDKVEEEGFSQTGQESVLKKCRLSVVDDDSDGRIETLVPFVPSGPTSDRLIAQDLQEYTLGSQEAIYLHRMQRKGPLEDVIKKRPCYKDVIDYIQTLDSETQPQWYKTSTNAIVDNDHLNFPNPPVLMRAYIAPFLQEPAKTHTWERECSRANCVSLRNGGFRCRELLHPDDMAKIMIYPEKERFKHLPVLVGWCYLCHLEDVTNSYLSTLRKTDELRRQIGIVAIHKFIVQINVPGEYKLEKTCLGDNKFCGIFGPVPMFSPVNYSVTTFPNGQRGWLESDKLVFR